MQWMLLMGVVTGMRSMTALAVLCWFAWLGLLPETGWAHWSATAVAAIAFGLCALGEYAGDVMPQAPSRTTMLPMIVRLVFGGTAGALCAHAITQPAVGGVILGVLGVLIGAYGCVRLRVWLARQVGRDWPVGVTESAIALGVAIVAAMALHQYALKDAAQMRMFQ
jgi:uncharacterized membrane protein